METNRSAATALTAQRNALAKALALGGSRVVKRLRYGTYKIASASQVGGVRTVHQEENGLTCDCPAGEHNRACWHVAAVLIAKYEATTGCKVKAVSTPKPVAFLTVARDDFADLIDPASR